MNLTNVAKELIDRMGSDVSIFKQGNHSDNPDYTVHGLKNSKKGTRATVFQFKEAQDIKVGDVIVQNSARDRWEVTSIEDVIAQGSYSHFEVFVTKEGANTRESDPPQQNITYNLLGANSRINNQSMDNSTNIQSNISENITELISNLREEIKKLGVESRIEDEALEIVDLIESQSMQQKPNIAAIKSIVSRLKELLPHAANIASIGSLILAAFR